MALNFNIDPYYDDFDQAKEFYRILFRPGRAVQARELTQIQTILQNQISNFGKGIYREGSIVTGAEHYLDDTCFYIKCKTSFNATTVDFSDLEGKYIVETSTNKIALIKKFVAAEGTDPPTLYVSVVSGSPTTFNSNSNFNVVETVNSTTIVNQFSSVDTTASGTSLLFHINEGVFYAKDTFLYCKKDTIVVEKYSKSSSHVVGLQITESVADYTSDSSLLDPALGTSNYLAPGADRYKIDLQLARKDYTNEGSYEDFIEILKIKDGILQSDKRFPLYSNIMDTMARRTYDESGDYIVRNFIPKILPDYQANNKLILEISAGKAYVKGYEVETIYPTTISLNKSRSTETIDQFEISTYFGNYCYVNNIVGELPNLDQQYQVEIHSTSTSRSSNTKIGTAYINNIDYISGSGANCVYALFLQDINLTSTSFAGTKSFVIPNGTDYDTPTFSATIDNSGTVEGITQLYDSKYASLIFNSGRNNVKDLTNVEYTYKHYSTGTVSGNTVSITCPASHSFISGTSATHYRQNYLIVNDTTNAFIPTDAGLSVTLSNPYTAIIDFGTSAYNGDTVKIIATVRTTNDTPATKTLVSNYAPTAANSEFIVNSINPVSLLKSDIYSLTGVYEFESTSLYKGTWSSGTTYDINDVVIFNSQVYKSLQDSNSNKATSNTSWWSAITNSVSQYKLNNGQTDYYYDHGTISRRTKPESPIKIVPVFSYFTHSGDGHISSISYPISYENIPTYTSPVTGISYSLTDVIDFRPRRIDDTTNFELSSRQKPQPFTNAQTTIEYYLARVDKVILTKDGAFKLLEGVPSYLNAKPPANQEDSITLYQLTYYPYTSDVSDVDIRIFPYRRYTMKDIAGIDDRVSRVEYYTSLNLLEKEVEAATLYGENGAILFKNGFLVDSFKGHNVGDVYSSEYLASIDYTNGTMRPLYLNEHTTLDYIRANSTANIQTSLVTVPFTEETYITQPIASNYMSVNPFNVTAFIGRISLTPESDTWFDTTSAPQVVVNVDGQNDNYAGFTSVETQWNAWETIWTGERILENTKQTSVVNSREITRATVEVSQQQRRTGFEILQAPPSVVLSTATNIINQEIIPYARAKQINFHVTGLAPNIPLSLYINNLNMSNCLFPIDRLVGGTSNTYPGSPVYTDASGSARGIIKFPNNTNTKFLAGKQNIVLSDNPFDYKFSKSFAEATFFAQGLLQKTQNVVYSTRGGYQIKRDLTDSRVNVTTQTRELSNVAIFVDTTPNAIYSLVADRTSVREGDTVSFVFTAQNAPAGKIYLANIAGTIANTDIVGYTKGNLFIQTSGTQALNKATINIPIDTDIITENDEFLVLNVHLVEDPTNPKLGSTQTLSANVTVKNIDIPLFNASAPIRVTEGNTITAILSATNLTSNANISYAVSGTIDANDYTGNTSTGTFVLTPSSGSKTLNFTTSTDTLSEGYETFIITYTLPDGTTIRSTTRVNDPDPPIFNINAPVFVTEGNTLTAIISSNNLSSNCSISYRVEGTVSSSDYTGNTSTGSFTLTPTSNSKTLTFNISNDVTTEGTETFIIRYDLPDGRILRSNTLILDTSTSPQTFTLSTPSSVLEGNTLTAVLSASNLTANVNVSYAVSGNVSSSDYTGNTSTGTFTLTSPSSSKTLNFNITNDGVFDVNGDPDGTEIFTITYTLPDGYTISRDIRILDTTSSATYTVNSPTSIDEGDVLAINVTTTSTSTQTVSWNLSNPNGVWFTNRNTTGTTLQISGEYDYASYVDIHDDILAAYEDGLNGTTLYSQLYTTVFPTADAQYQSWLNNDAWRVESVKGKAAFGLWHWSNYGKNELGRLLPVNSIVSGTASLSNTSPALIRLYVNPDKTRTANATVTFTILDQTRTIKINDTSKRTLPILDPITRKVPGTGDFIDSDMTIAQALEEATYVLGASETLAQAYANPASKNKSIFLKSSQLSKRDTFGTWVANYYRNPSKINRNPDKGGFIFWVKRLLDLVYGTERITSETVYPVGTLYSVWVNSGTDVLVDQWQTRYRKITIPTTGTYTFEAYCDDLLEVDYKVQGTGTKETGWSHLISASHRETSKIGTVKSITITANAGTYILRFNALNGNFGSNYSSNPGYWSFAVKNSSDTVIWDTRTYAAAEEVLLGSIYSDAEAYLVVQSEIDEIIRTSGVNGKNIFVGLPFYACSTDPLAQTFFVSENVYPKGLFLTGVGLYFKGKDQNLPVFVEIRPTENGYPSSSQIVPLSTVSLNPNEVRVSDDASLETKFNFRDVVYLSPGEYSIIVGSNSDKYTVYFGELGARQIGTNSIISSQPYVGSLFKSQNASTWTAEQTMDLCFKLYKADFQTGSYTAMFENSAIPSDSFYNDSNPFPYHTVKLTSEEIDFDSATDITYEIKNQYQDVKDPNYTKLISNKNYNLGTTKEFGPDLSNELKVTLSTTDSDVSPVVDVERLSLIMVQNIINAETDSKIPETNQQGGDAIAKYVTRYVTLADGFDATGLRVILDVNRPYNTSIKVFAKIMATDDTGSFDDKYWQEISRVPNPDQFSVGEEYVNDEYKIENMSYVSNGLTYNNFRTFAIKIVMYSTDKAYVPQIKNLRVVATS